MLTKLFRCVVLFAFLSGTYFFVVFFFHKSKRVTLSLEQNQPKEKRNKTFSWASKEELMAEKMRRMSFKEILTTPKSKASNQIGARRSGETEMTGFETKIIGPCPEIPPDLMGPLRVEFDLKWTMGDVRQVISPPLKAGGRYKPPDCVARQKVAIIIPFRNRDEHLKHWLFYLHPVLIRQQADYGVFVINQAGDGLFNRAKLLNVGYVEVLKEYDYDCFVFSDIDLVPLNDRNLYRCFDNPRHLAVAMDKFNFRLPYNRYFGGVAALSKQQFLKINGFPNSYWGWGGEDDDIYKRIFNRGMSVSRPDLTTGRYKMIKHRRDLNNEPNPVNPGKLSKTIYDMNKDGINSLRYTVKEIVKDKLYTNITVDIEAPHRWRRG